MFRRTKKAWRGLNNACRFLLMVGAIGGVSPSVVFGQQSGGSSGIPFPYFQLSRPAQNVVTIEKLAEPADVPSSAAPTAEEKTLALLEKRLDFEFAEMPIKDVVEWFSRETKIPVVLDTKSLEGAGVGTDTPVTFQQKNFRGVSGLNHLLKSLDLWWRIDDGVLIISTRDEIENHLSTRVYNVLDIVTFREHDGKVTFDTQPLLEHFQRSGGDNAVYSLLDLIKCTCATPRPGWADDGGAGVIKFLPTGLMTITQTGSGHREIERLLKAVRLVQADYGKLPTTAAMPRVPTVPEMAPIVKLRKQFTEPIALELVEKPVVFREMTVQEFAAQLSKQLSVPFVLDTKIMERAGVSTGTSVSKVHYDVPLQVALKQILKDLALTFKLQEDAVVITTNEEAEKSLVTVVYPLRDLIQSNVNDEIVKDELDQIQDILTTAVGDPKPGFEVDGGVGTINLLVSHKALVIHQTQQVHDEIDLYFAELRKKTAEVRQSIRITSKASLPSTTYLLKRDESGTMKSTPEEVAKAIKLLLPDVNWELPGTALVVLSDRVVIRHERRVLWQVNELTKVEIQGWVEVVRKPLR